jgi:hypothetical protein
MPRPRAKILIHSLYPPLRATACLADARAPPYPRTLPCVWTRSKSTAWRSHPTRHSWRRVATRTSGSTRSTRTTPIPCVAPCHRAPHAARAVLPAPPLPRPGLPSRTDEPLRRPRPRVTGNKLRRPHFERDCGGLPEGWQVDVHGKRRRDHQDMGSQVRTIVRSIAALLVRAPEVPRLLPVLMDVVPPLVLSPCRHRCVPLLLQGEGLPAQL